MKADRVRYGMAAFVIAVTSAIIIVNQNVVVHGDDDYCFYTSAGGGGCEEYANNKCTDHDGYDCRQALGQNSCFCVPVAQ